MIATVGVFVEHTTYKILSFKLISTVLKHQPFGVPGAHSPTGVGGLVVHTRCHYQPHLESAERYNNVQKCA